MYKLLNDHKKLASFYLLIISSLIVIIFFPYFKWLIMSWKNVFAGTFGYLAPFVSIWAFYLKRKEFFSSSVNQYKPAWLVFTAGILLALFYRWNNQAIVASVALPLLLYGFSLICLGRAKTRFLVFPIFFLLFLYPWGGLFDAAAGFQLRRFSVYVSCLLYKTLGMEYAEISGTLLYTGRFLVDIAPACSGLTMMNVLLFMAAIGGYLYQGKRRGGFLIFLSVIPLSVVLNTFRVAVTGLAGHFYGEGMALSYYHDVSGIMVFGFAVLFLYWESSIFKRVENRK